MVTISKLEFGIVRANIVKIKENGSPVLSICPEKLFENGYECGDMLEIEIEGVGCYCMPFVERIIPVGYLGIFLCDYFGAHKELTLKINNGSFVDWVGGEKGAAVSISMKEKAGYLERYNNLNIEYTNDRKDYATDEAYTNFRMVDMECVARGVLYRGSSPLNFLENEERYKCVDYLCQRANIKSMVNLADSEEEIEKYMSRHGADTPYSARLFEQHQIVAAKMKPDFFTESTMKQLAKGFRFMLSHEGPYLIHCNEGKDRTGVAMIILEALAGAKMSDIRKDYMLTYENYYRIKEGTERYKMIQSMMFDRLIYMIAQPQKMAKFNEIDWNYINVEGVNTQQMAMTFLKYNIGLLEDEVGQLLSLVKGTGTF